MALKCSCNGKVDFSLVDVHLNESINPIEAEVEGICLKCGSSVYVRFKPVKVEITNYDQDSTKFYDIEAGTGQLAIPL